MENIVSVVLNLDQCKKINNKKKGETRMELLEVMQRRRSVRLYTKEEVPEEKLNQILQAGLLSASGKGVRPWEFIVVRKK